MTEQEYIAALNRIYHSETGEEPAETERLLERLYTVKPVRLSWYTAKAKTYGKIAGHGKRYFLFWLIKAGIYSRIQAYKN